MAVERTLSEHLTPPEKLTPRQRAREIAAMLATAIARLDATRPRESDLPLGFSAPERLHTTPSQRGV